MKYKKTILILVMVLLMVSITIAGVTFNNRQSALAELRQHKTIREAQLNTAETIAINSLVKQTLKECFLDYEDETVVFCKLNFNFTYNNEVIQDFIDVPEVVPADIDDFIIANKIKPYIQMQTPQEQFSYMENGGGVVPK